MVSSGLMMHENRMHVRNYYRKHRSAIVSHKAFRACRLHGRVPFAATILEHKLPLQELTVAFGEWQASRATDDVLSARRSLRFMRVLTQLQALNASEGTRSSVGV